MCSVGAGYWGWDPVEIAAFMPWLTGTAFLHSVMIQEKRGLFKHWNMVLIILTYDLVIFGTFLTRSGVLSSVHAFAQSAIGPAFFGFIALTFAVSLALLLCRWNELKTGAQMTSLFSREALFLLNNLLFMGILIVCFWGVIYPLYQGTVYRAEGDRRPALLRAGHRASIWWSAAVNGHRSAFRLGPFHAQDPADAQFGNRLLASLVFWQSC